MIFLNSKPDTKLRGALLTFIVLQLLYIFFFFSQFPESFRNALDLHDGVLDAAASGLSSLTMLGYCIICLVAVAQLVMRKPGFLFWFQISGAIALIGNFIIFVLRQIAESLYSSGYYGYYGGDYYWVLFIMALFWTIIWCMYFARSSRVFSYMGENGQYLQMALFTKNVTPPAPWEEPQPVYPVYPAANPNMYTPGYNQQPVQQYPNMAQQQAGYQQPQPPVPGPPPAPYVPAQQPVQQNEYMYPNYMAPQPAPAQPAYPAPQPGEMPPAYTAMQENVQQNNPADMQTGFPVNPPEPPFNQEG